MVGTETTERRQSCIIPTADKEVEMVVATQRIPLPGVATASRAYVTI